MRKTVAYRFFYVTGRILKIRYHTEIIDSIYLLCVPKNVRERGNSGFRCQVRKLEIKTRVLDGAHAGSLSKIKERRPPFSLSLYSVTFISFFLSPMILHFGVSSCRGGFFDSFTNNNTIKDISLAPFLKQKKDVDLKGHARAFFSSPAQISPIRCDSFPIDWTTSIAFLSPPYPPYPPLFLDCFRSAPHYHGNEAWKKKKSRLNDWMMMTESNDFSIYKSIPDIFLSSASQSRPFAKGISNSLLHIR